MMELFPEGKSLGWMQAPPQWIFSHTVRFIGVVRIVIQDGEGFILVKKGKPLAYYFKHGQIELRGHAALDYFRSHQTLEFNLCKYTPEEFSQALRILNIDSEEPVMNEVSAPVPEGYTPSPGRGYLFSHHAIAGRARVPQTSRQSRRPERYWNS